MFCNNIKNWQCSVFKIQIIQHFQILLERLTKQRTPLDSRVTTGVREMVQQLRVFAVRAENLIGFSAPTRWPAIECISIPKGSNTPLWPTIHTHGIHNTSKTPNTHGICKYINIFSSRIDNFRPEGVWFLIHEGVHVTWNVKKGQQLDYYMGVCSAVPLAVNFYSWNHDGLFYHLPATRADYRGKTQRRTSYFLCKQRYLPRLVKKTKIEREIANSLIVIIWGKPEK